MNIINPTYKVNMKYRLVASTPTYILNFISALNDNIYLYLVKYQHNPHRKPVELVLVPGLTLIRRAAECIRAVTW